MLRAIAAAERLAFCLTRTKMFKNATLVLYEARRLLVSYVARNGE